MIQGLGRQVIKNLEFVRLGQVNEMRTSTKKSPSLRRATLRQT